MGRRGLLLRVFDLRTIAIARPANRASSASAVQNLTLLCGNTDDYHTVATDYSENASIPRSETWNFVGWAWYGSRADVARRKEQQRSFFAEMEGNIRTKIGQGVLFGGATPPSMPSTPAGGSFSLSIVPVSHTMS